MRNVFVKSLTAAADDNPNIMLLSGDLGFGALEPFIEKHPDKFINAGVAEQNMIGMAAGMATSGFKVFVYSIANFPIMRCLEQIRNDVCYHDLDVTIVSVGAGFTYGVQGYTHHAIEDIGVMRCMKGMQIFSPCDPTETKYATIECTQSVGPKYLRLGRAGDQIIFQDENQLSKGGVNFAYRERQETLIICTGSIIVEAVAARKLLAQQQIHCDIASILKLRPLDTSYLVTVLSEYQKVVVLEEHIDRGGLLDILSPIFFELKEMMPSLLPLNINYDSQFGKNGSQTFLRHVNGLSALSIASKIRDDCP